MSSARPLVSILINNYNYGRFLRDSIGSALNQTYHNTEVIVVDDGSTDDSREIIASYGNRIVPILKENGGQASTLNAGFDTSRGEFVCLMDSDDVWLPEKVARVVAGAVSYPNATLIYHRVQPVTADLKPCRRIIPTGVFTGDIASKVEKSAGWWSCSPTSGLCFRRSALQRIGCIPEQEFRICADAFLLYLAPLVGPVLGLKDCLALYRLHGDNYLSNSSPAGNDGQSVRSRWYVDFFPSTISVVNSRLTDLGVCAVFRLEDHWSYQFQKFRLSAPGRHSALRLAWRALELPGEPAVTNRIRTAASVILQGCFLRE